MPPAVLHRAVFVENLADPIASQSAAGRYHADGQRAAYLAATRHTAWAEVRFRWPADAADYVMFEIVCEVPVLDLTDPEVQTAYGVTEEDLVSPDHAICQRLATRLRAEGKMGVWTYSAADRGGGRQLVVFIDLIDRPEWMPRILSSGPVDPV